MSASNSHFNFKTVKMQNSPPLNLFNFNLTSRQISKPTQTQLSNITSESIINFTKFSNAILNLLNKSETLVKENLTKIEYKNLVHERNTFICNRTGLYLNERNNDNIWKLAFFVLSFLVGFVSLILIVAFSVKILLSKTQNREKLVSQIRKKPSKISTISLLEFDPEMSLASNFASSPLKKNLSNKKRANSSSSSSHLTPVKKDLEMMNTKDVNLTTTTSIADYSSTHHYSPEHLYSDFFKDTNQAQNLPSNKQQQQEQEQEPNCLIYGITNKAFFVSQKMQDKPPTHTLKFEHDILFRKTSNIPSTFRPLESKKSSTKINLNESTALLNEAKDTIGFKKEGDEDKEGFLLPWKHQLPSVLTNDYDTLDIKSVNGSLANLSSVTTYSEVFNESKLDSDTSSPSVSSSTNRIRDFNLMCLNNTELVMNSSKITQELEKKLKERRKLMESKSDKFQPKILEVNEFNCMNQTLSLSNLEKRLKDWKIEFNTTKPKLTSSSISCVCPCHNHLHSHSHSKLGSTVCLSRKESKEKEKEKELNILRKTSFQNRQINKAKEVKSAEWSNKCKKPKIVIDNASRLPTKRESIRALIESKAVSQNKQKDVLEMHLNTLLSSRRSTCKIIE